jgi:hypothetical protein
MSSTTIAETAVMTMEIKRDYELRNIGGMNSPTNTFVSRVKRDEAGPLVVDLP